MGSARLAPVASEWMRESWLRLDPARACVCECVWREEGNARGLARPRDEGGCHTGTGNVLSACAGARAYVFQSERVDAAVLFAEAK